MREYSDGYLGVIDRLDDIILEQEKISKRCTYTEYLILGSIIILGIDLIIKFLIIIK